MIKHSWGLEIAYQRYKKGVSQSELARAIGHSQGAVALWESGKRVPSILAMKKMAEYFDIPLDEFLERGYSDAEITPPHNEERNEHLQFLNQMRRLAPQLNKAGQDKVIQYASDLSENPKYAASSDADPEDRQPD